MSKIIKIESYNAYNQQLKESIVELEKIKQSLLDMSVNIAISGRWKKWSDDQPVGTEFEFTREMLSNTGDKIVDSFVEIIDHIEDLQEELTNA
jgi:hypothetical protein